MPIQPKQPTAEGPAEWFTGDVFLDPIVRGEEPSRVRVSAVRFTPSARTAWHAHALGQTLYVTEGRGLVQSRGGAVEELRAGDVVVTPPDEWHWHGAAPDHYMTHLSITEAPGDERPETDWGEHVTDDEYHNRSSLTGLGCLLDGNPLLTMAGGRRAPGPPTCRHMRCWRCEPLPIQQRSRGSKLVTGGPAGQGASVHGRAGAVASTA